MKDEANQIQIFETKNVKKTISESEEQADADGDGGQGQGQGQADRLRESITVNGSLDSKSPKSSFTSTSTSNSILNSLPLTSTSTTKQKEEEKELDPPTNSISTSSTSSSTSTSPPHLNPHSILIKDTPHSGRGLFTSTPLKAGTLLEISPVLLFPAEEYQSFGRFTRLDDYTFVWRKGQGGKDVMALALGLGSLFNHHPTSPNVSYTLSHSDESIRYILIRDVEAGEELCISYGAGRMWWDKEDDTPEKRREKNLLEKERREANDEAAEWRKMAGVSDPESISSEEREEEETDTEEEEVIKEEIASTSRTGSSLQASNLGSRNHRPKIVVLPRDSASTAAAITASKTSIPRNPQLFRITAALDPAEAPLILVNAWAIDVPPRLSNHVLQWLKVNSRALSRRTRRRIPGGSNLNSNRGERSSGSENSSNSNDSSSFEDEEEGEEEEEVEDESEEEEFGYDPDRGIKHLRAFRRSDCGRDKNSQPVLTALICLESEGPNKETIVGLLRSRDEATTSSHANSNHESITSTSFPSSFFQESQAQGSGPSPLGISSTPNTTVSSSTSINSEISREFGKGKSRLKIKPSSSLPDGYDPEPYLVSVPAGPAPSKARLQEWCSHWPVVIRHGIDPLALSGSGSGASTPINQIGGSCSPSSSSSSLPPPGAMNNHPSAGPLPGLVDRVEDSKSWTPKRVRWAQENFKLVIELAKLAKENGQLPIAAHVTPSFNPGEESSVAELNNGTSEDEESVTNDDRAVNHQDSNFISSASKSISKSSFVLPRNYLRSDAWDTRIKERNPIKHAVINVIKEVAEKRAERDRSSNLFTGLSSDAVRGDTEAQGPKRIGNPPQGSTNGEISRTNSPTLPQIESPKRVTIPRSSTSSPTTPSANANANANGTSTPNTNSKDQDYLLTTLSLFITHEPCAHCCMALVHSRVKAVYFLLPSPGAGGCCGANQVRPCIGGEDGGPYALQEERGLNHRFEVWRWVGGMRDLLNGEEEGESGKEDKTEEAARRNIKMLLETGGVDP